MPIVAKKSNWATEFMNPETKNFAQRLVAFAVVEGIFFSGSFCAIYWLKSKNKMVQTLGTSNELIARDEALHTRFAIELYKLLRNKLTQDEIERIVRPAVAIEVEFICRSIRCPMIGMNETMMSQYIKFCADRLLSQLGYKKIYNTKNPFPFMEAVGLGGKTNFFEKRTTEYQLASAVSGKITYEVTNDF
jgi:ribonucleoside-diphosphate reductase beta chain